MIVIDGKDLIFGRVASVSAKKALFGEKVVLLNCQDIVITGSKASIISKIKHLTDISHPYQGPYISKMPDRLVRRMIRNMLPYKKERGKKALKRIHCHIGVPEKYLKEKPETIDGAHVSKLRDLKFIRIRDISGFYNRKTQ